MSDESIEPPTTSNEVLNPSVDSVGSKIRVKFNGHCFKQHKITFNHGKVVSIYIVYEIEIKRIWWWINNKTIYYKNILYI